MLNSCKKGDRKEKIRGFKVSKGEGRKDDLRGE